MTGQKKRGRLVAGLVLVVLVAAAAGRMLQSAQRTPVSVQASDAPRDPQQDGSAPTQAWARCEAAAEVNFSQTEEEGASSARSRTESAREDNGTKAGGQEREITAEALWADAYRQMMYEEELSSELLLALALAEAESRALALLAVTGDKLVTYNGTRFVMSADDYEVLLRIVESEAPTEDKTGKMLVACVVLNRVLASGFPDTVGEVVFQKNQFAPIASGYYWRVKITQSTREAVEQVLSGEDISGGALFFMEREKAKPKNVKWFDTNLTFLFKHGCHEFFAPKEE